MSGVKGHQKPCPETSKPSPPQQKCPEPTPPPQQKCPEPTPPPQQKCPQPTPSPQQHPDQYKKDTKGYEPTPKCPPHQEPHKSGVKK
ncbi:hypothetical protein FKM82_015280 [Ascaphus truei]